jgi:cytochrome P450
MATLDADLADFLTRPWDDPAPLFHRMQDEAPVLRGADGLWHVTRYADVDAVARERDAKYTRNSGGRDVGFVRVDPPGPAQLLLARSMGFGTHDDHKRLRRLVSKAFTPRSVARMADEIGQRARRLAAGLAASGGGDLVADFSLQLPIETIAGMFGMGAEHHHQLHSIGVAMVSVLDFAATDETRARADKEAQEFGDTILGLAAERREHPGDDLLSELVAAEEEGRRLSREELVSACFQLTAAGHETTMNLVSNLVYTLLRDRRRWEEVCGRPELIPDAVEEGLRYESPLRATVQRWPLTDTRIGGTPIAAGEKVVSWIGAANRDPSVFENPDQFDLHRTANPHLAFSAGTHYCLGANLARLEATAALRELTTQLPDLELVTDKPSWLASFTTRGLTTLPVRRR